MKLIADSGSTKTDWAVSDGGRVTYFKSSGRNPNYVGREEMMADLSNSFPESLSPEGVTELYFYGAGVSEANAAALEAMFRDFFPSLVRVEIASDMLGAARALLGCEAGCAAVLGTGANSCLYDGSVITMNVPSLGFVLGDEGSAAYIGKTALRDYMRRTMPPSLRDSFRSHLGMSDAQIISRIYTQPKANSFCGSVCNFITEHQTSSEYCRKLLTDSFRSFFRNMICLYPHHSDYSLNCVGSLALVCRDILASVAAEFGMVLGKTIQAPISGLVEYHRERVTQKPRF